MTQTYLSIKEGVRTRQIDGFDLLGGIEQLAAMFKDQEELIEELQTKVDQLTAENEKINEDLDEAEGKIEDLQRELDEANEDYHQLEKELGVA